MPNIISEVLSTSFNMNKLKKNAKKKKEQYNFDYKMVEWVSLRVSLDKEKGFHAILFV